MSYINKFHLEGTITCSIHNEVFTLSGTPHGIDENQNYFYSSSHGYESEYFRSLPAAINDMNRVANNVLKDYYLNK